MYKAALEKHALNFKRPGGTSRGVLTQKDSWFIRIWYAKNSEIKGIGEASIIKTLSPEWSADYQNFIAQVVENINNYVGDNIAKLMAYPSIYMAVENALLDLKNGGQKIWFSSDFTQKNAPIKINGLIWMGTKAFMLAQIEEKLAAGFDCIKLKIGAIDFESELELLKFIRSRYSKNEIEIRVDANGAFAPDEALHKLTALAEFDLHSIEQPIKQGQWGTMRHLCEMTPLPIALDEELIGITEPSNKRNLLTEINPQYIILKPSLIGGFKGTDEWIELAEEMGINWWITSALESNIGLNAIAQYTFTKNNSMPQGLGTGQLYTNNIPSPLRIEKGQLVYGG